MVAAGLKFLWSLFDWFHQKLRRWLSIETEKEKKERNLGDQLQNLADKQEELFKPIQDKVASAIKAVGDEKGYTFIITPEVLLYVNPNAENATAAVKAKLGIQ